MVGRAEVPLSPRKPHQENRPSVRSETCDLLAKPLGGRRVAKPPLALSSWPLMFLS